MNQVVFVADNHGTILDEIKPDLGSISWRLSNVGSTKLTLSTRDDKANQDNFRFGNRVLIQFDNGLPDWGGVIDTPREWKDGSLVASVYSGEYLLSLRQTGKNRRFTGASVGTIFNTLIKDANAGDDLGIHAGEIWPGGFHFSLEFHYENLLKIIQDTLCGQLSIAEFSVTASQADGRIVMYANLYERRGAIKTNVYLEAGKNITAARLLEQGPLINWWDVAGADINQGNGWGSGRLTAHADDQQSWGEYGLRQGSAILSSASEIGEIQAAAESNLAKTRHPHNMLSLTVGNSDPAGFEAYDIGDVISVSIPGVGFGGYEAAVRIVSREYNPDTGSCDLVVQEWFGD